MKKFLFLILIAVVDSAFAATNVILEGCETLSFDKSRGNNCQILKGNVRFRHDRTLMFCDSAYFYSSENSFDAFGHVRVVDDSVQMTSNKMFYDGNSKIMRVRENIVMRNGAMTLSTDKLDYYRTPDYAFYDNGAVITDPEFTLKSVRGYYYPKTKQARFAHNVDFVSKVYKITTDTMNYNTRTEDASVEGNSVITHEKYVITTTKGALNNKTGDFSSYRRSSIVSNDGTQSLEADTILYNRTTGKAEVYGDIYAVDTKQHIAARGGVGRFTRQPLHSGFLTRNAYMMEFSEKDTMHIHADTLNLEQTLPDSVDYIYGRHNVRFFRNDFQGKCELLTYSTKDSSMQMEVNPVMWSDDNQLTGDTVRLYLKDRKPDWMHILGKAQIEQKDDSVNFNQLAGKELKGYFFESKLRKVVLNGNAVAIYFPKDNAGDLIGVNRSEGAQMTIYMDEKRKLEKIVMEPGSIGTMYPPFEAPHEAMFLNGFSWQDSKRPKKPSDIFLPND